MTITVSTENLPEVARKLGIGIVVKWRREMGTLIDKGGSEPGEGVAFGGGWLDPTV